MLAPAHCRQEAFGLFQQQLATVKKSSSLFQAAFAISLHERPEANWDEVDTTIKKLADAIRLRVKSGAKSALTAHLHDVLFDVIGFRGNESDYYNPANSYLPDVLKTRRGIPISLVLVYKQVADHLGLKVFGINTPGHFLAEIESDETAEDEKMYIDPFYGGGVLNRSEVAERIAQATGKMPTEPLKLERATHRQWLARMLVNLQASFASLGQERDVYAMQELQQLLQH